MEYIFEQKWRAPTGKPENNEANCFRMRGKIFHVQEKSKWTIEVSTGYYNTLKDGNFHGHVFMTTAQIIIGRYRCA